MVASRKRDRDGAVPDIVEQCFRLVEAPRVRHRQDGLDVRLAVDHVGAPPRLEFDAAPLAQRELAVGCAEEEPAQLLDAVGDGAAAL